jgi:hypothetical protein
LLDYLAKSVLLVHRVLRESRDLLGLQVFLDCQVKLEQLVHKVLKEIREIKESKG